MRTAILSISFFALTAACSGARWEGIWGAPSPGQTRFVEVFRQNRAAFDSYQYKITVHGSDYGGAREPNLQSVAWRSEGCRPVYVFWKSETELEVLVDPSQRHCDSGVIEASVEGVRVETKPLRGWSKSEILSDQ